MITEQLGVKVKKELVVEAANNALEINDAERQKYFEKEVQRHIEQWRILSFFWMKPFTREDAEAFIKKHPSVAARWRIEGWVTRGQAKELLAACSVTESELVELDIDDAAFVRKWRRK